jgi:hypothetical protein
MLKVLEASTKKAAVKGSLAPRGSLSLATTNVKSGLSTVDATGHVPAYDETTTPT